MCTRPQYGWTSSSKPEGEIKLLRTTDISKLPVSWNNVPFCDKAPENIEKYQVEMNDVLVSRAGSIGLSYRIKEDDLIDRTVFASYLIRFKPLINPQFVEYYLNSNIYWEYISEFKTGIAIPNVNATKLSDMPFPLPPLAEQQRIATKLDYILPRVEKLKERLQKVPELIKQFRQSVLNAAVTGELAEENHGKIEYSLKEISEYQGGYAFKSKLMSKTGKHQIIKIANITKTGLNLTKFPAFISDKYIKETSRFKILKNDILVSMTGTRNKRDYGYAVLVEEDNHIYLNQRVGRLRPNCEIVNPKYLQLFLNSEEYREFFFKDETGNVNQGNVGSNALKNAIVQLPHLKEQHEIVRRVDALFGIADKLEERLAAISQQVESLGKSVLAKAFHGELVPTEAELAEMEGRSYETAEELLERIKAEKKKLEVERKKHRKRK